MKPKIACFFLLFAFLEVVAFPQKPGKPVSPSNSAPGQPSVQPQKPAELGSPSTPGGAANESPLPIYKYEQRGRRDPFRSLDVTTSMQAASAPIVRPPGLKGQLVSEIKVVGILKNKGELMAIAQGYRNKTYFIHPSDILFDGKVLEIRRDLVLFTQTLTDNFGKKLSQQVTKKLYPTRGEGNNEK